MCAIFGAINLEGVFNSRDFEKFESLTNLVKYRGPDASGCMVFNTRENLINDKNKFDIFLGHRRLSIIDLSENANQPLSDGDALWIIYNGEIFNYVELREELRSEGYVFRTGSDTSVILNIYKKFGEAGFEKFNGMWAFAIVDLQNKKVVLSRDRFSIKPLYYTRLGGQFYFASEIKQLLPLLKERKINKEVLFKYLEQGLIDYNEQTFFDGIYKLKPKHNLTIHLDKNEIKESKYWDYTMEEVQDVTAAEICERFRELFIDSVKIRLRSDVKVGALLSGGLDSSSIAVVANNIVGNGFDTYSIVSRNKTYSEEKYIDILSSACKISNHKVLFDFEDLDMFTRNINKVIYHQEEPFGGFSVIAQYMVLETIKRNSDIKVILSGQGGDEILMGYLKYFFFNIKRLINQGAAVEALTQILYSLIRKTVIWQFNLNAARRYIPFLIKKTPKSFLKIHNALEPTWEAEDLINRQILDIDKYSVPALTHYEDRNSMAHSLEIRLPFLDHRLVNFVLGLPVTLKLNNGWTKYILRKSMHELPQEIRWRKDKQGFITPQEIWLKRDLSELIHNIFAKSILDEMEIIDSKAFLEYYQKFKNGNRAIWHSDIAKTMIAELWARKFMGKVDD